MTEALNEVYKAIDHEHRHESAATRRQIVGGAAVALGGMGLLGMSESAMAQGTTSANDAATIANVAATAEVLATIVNTVGAERVSLEPVTKKNVDAAAREELIHYEVLVSNVVGGKAITKLIHVPDEVFSSPQALLTTLAVGDQIFINAYLLGITVFARGGGLKGSRFARYLAEFMGAEAVHRALALQSLGRLGNDRAFMRFGQKEETPGLPSTGSLGFGNITDAVKQLEAAGFGFGKAGSKPGQMYDFDVVSKRTPEAPQVHTRTPN